MERATHWRAPCVSPWVLRSPWRYGHLVECTAPRRAYPPGLERLKKFCSHSERGFLGVGEALAKEQVQGDPVTEPKRSQDPKRPLPPSLIPNGYSISENALNRLPAP
jgi:hypothetical protein